MTGGLIKHLSLHKPLPTGARLDVWPFGLMLIGLIVQYIRDTESGILVLGGLALVLFLRLLAFLFSQWFVGVYTFLTCRTVRNVADAKWAKVVPQAHKGASELCEIQHKTLKDQSTKVWFSFQKRNFIYDATKDTWTKIVYPIDKKYGDYVAMMKNQTYATEDALERGKDTFGPNVFDIPMPTFSDLYKEHALAPFFVFQVFCVALWCLDEYWYYSLFTLFMLLVFEAAVVKSRLYNLRVLRAMVQEPKNLNVYRKGAWSMLKSDQLLPGDLVSIGRWGEESTIPCELLLLSGTCVVNEAMLTGESTPQLKESIAHEDMTNTFDMKRDGKVHVLFGGTRLVQHSPDKDTPLKSPNNGCLAIVLRTGFETSQGKLMRTILFSTQRVTANTLETFFFILFLLCFALAASGYVLKHGLMDPERSRYKLMLECVLIITSVVPPELPMELSLAVNSSLIALTRMHSIFCTEPFRIPLAGKVDVCCFDKTGTLTTDHITLKGLAGVTPGEPSALTPPSAVPDDASFVIGGCHALVYVENSLVGDPMETAALQAIGWSWNRSDVATAKGGRTAVRVAHRSSLRRMSAIAVVEHNGALQNYALCKGAPEVIEKRLKTVPDRYEETYKYWSRAGCRVLALGLKELQGTFAMHELKALPRESIETDLRFAGFLVFECPVKPDSEAAVDMLLKASHRVIMITGDNTLTACQVAKNLKIMTKSPLILSYRKETDTLQWQRLDESVHSAFSPKDPWRALAGEYDLCISGDSLERLIAMNVSRAGHFFSHVRVFARTSPDQKEAILTALKRDGMTTLMCGDGTNDVGALKQAHVGVALLNVEPNTPISVAPAPVTTLATTTGPPVTTGTPAGMVGGVRQRRPAAKGAPEPAAAKTPARPKQIVGPFGITINAPPSVDDGEVPLVRLGDASIASPFTAKTSSVMSIAHIIRQGRCTLVTTLQMFKILALNCLISAYSLSVLYLDGIKMGDTQATIVGMMIALCFLFLSHSKPLHQLSAKRPLPNIFSLYMLLSIIGQFAIHLTSLMFVVDLAKSASPDRQKPDTPFEPNLLNTCVFLISSSMQVSTFAINYKGHPFKDSLLENRKLLYCLLTPLAIVLLAATEIVPGFNWLFELVAFPSISFRGKMLGTILLDFAASFSWEQLVVLIMEPLGPMLSEVTERISQLARLCKAEDVPVNRWIADGVKKQLELITYNANLYSLLVQELKKSDGSVEVNKQLVGLVRLGLSIQRGHLLELRASFSKMPMIVKGACEELSQLFVVVDRTYADFYRSQLQERARQNGEYAKLVAAHQDRISALERKLRSQEEEAAKGQQLLSAELDEAQRSLQWFDQQRTQRAQKIVGLVEFASAVKQEHRTFKFAVSADLRKISNMFLAIRDALAMQQAEVKQTRARAEQAESELYKCQASVMALQELITKLTEEKEDQAQQISVLTAEAERQARELAHTDIDAQKMHARLLALQEEKQTLSRQHEALVQKYTEVKKELERQLSKATEEGKANAAQIDELREQLGEAQRSVESLTKLKERLQRENARLSIDASIARQDIIRLRSSTQQLESEANQVISLKEDVRQAQQKEKAAQSALEKAMADADQQREWHAAEIASLRRTLAAAEASARTRDVGRHEEKEEELRAARAKASSAEERVVVLREALAAERDKAAEAKADTEDLMRNRDELAQKLVESELEVQRIRASSKSRPSNAAPAKERAVTPPPPPVPIVRPEPVVAPGVKPAAAPIPTELPNYFGLRFEQLKRSIGRGAQQSSGNKKKMMHILHPPPEE